jgi:ArsR family transcriptional regulator, lead/cadmium/zinc/bismuth-responsive transcriptional repressor
VLAKEQGKRPMNSAPTPPAEGIDPECSHEDHEQGPAEALPVSDEAFERAAALFRAMGDTQRLRLLQHLSQREWCVTELAETMKDGLSTISQRLRLLRAEGLVSRRRSGKHIYYSLADSHVSEMIHNALEHASEDDSHHDRRSK